MRAQDAGRERGRAAVTSLVVGAAIFAGKFAAYGLTGSTAVLSDALESTINVVAAALLLFSVYLAAQPADRNHPYGHGKIEFFSAGVEGTLILVAGVLILLGAGRELLRGPELSRLDLGMLLVAGLAGANGLLGVYLVRVGQRTGSIAIEADGRHVLTDVVTSVGVVFALGAVRVTGWAWLDPLVAIGLALHILYTGAELVRRSIAGLMDEADEALLTRITDSLESHRSPEWIDVHSLRAFKSGHQIHVDLHVTVPRFLDVLELHSVHDAVDAAVREATRSNDEAIAHFDPCEPHHCSGCAMKECKIRTSPLESREPLTLENSVGDPPTPPHY